MIVDGTISGWTQAQATHLATRKTTWRSAPALRLRPEWGTKTLVRSQGETIAQSVGP
jgi:hypothetical protein